MIFGNHITPPKGNPSIGDPLLDDFQRRQRERDLKKDQYIRDLRVQMNADIQKKKVELQQRKLNDKLEDDKIRKHVQELNERSADNSHLEGAKTRRQEPLPSVSANTIASPLVQDSKEMGRGYFESSFGSPLESPIRESPKLLEYSPPLGEMRPFKVNIFSSNEYLRVKQNLQEEKARLARFRNQVIFPSRRSRLMRSGQSALENLKQITAELKSGSQSMPFILPVHAPKSQLNLRSDYPPLKSSVNSRSEYLPLNSLLVESYEGDTEIELKSTKEYRY